MAKVVAIVDKNTNKVVNSILVPDDWTGTSSNPHEWKPRQDDKVIDNPIHGIGDRYDAVNDEFIEIIKEDRGGGVIVEIERKRPKPEKKG